LRDNELGDLGVERLAALFEERGTGREGGREGREGGGEGGRGIESLVSGFNDVGSRKLEALGRAMKKMCLQRLQLLELSANRLVNRQEEEEEDGDEEEEEEEEVDDGGVWALTAALADGACSRLMTLLLDDTDLGEAGLLLLARAMESVAFPPSLRTLNLSGVGLTDEGLGVLGSALEKGIVGKSLQELVLDDGRYHKVGKEAVLAFLDTLLPSSAPSPAAAAAPASQGGSSSSSSSSLPPSLPVCGGELIHLSLRGLPLDDEGVKRFAAALRGGRGREGRREGGMDLGKLEVLDLADTLVGEEGYEGLMEGVGEGCPLLQTLSVAGTQVGNEGVFALVTRMVGGRGGREGGGEEGLVSLAICLRLLINF